MLRIEKAWKLQATYELEPLQIPGGDSLVFAVQVWERNSHKREFQARVLRRDSYEIRPAYGAGDGNDITFATVELVVPDDSHDWMAESHDSETAAVSRALGLLNKQLGLDS